MLPVFLINLERSKLRLQRMKEQAAAAGLEFEHFAAVDGAAHVPAWLRSEFDPHAGMSAGEIGCYASHLSLCAKMKEQQLAAAVLLEDDIILEPDFMQACERAVEAAPGRWDIIHLSVNFKSQPYVQTPLGDDRALVRFCRLPVNSAAYLISASGAEKLLQPGRRAWPYDMEFRYAWHRGLNVYGVFPPPARQNPDLASTINAGSRAPLPARRSAQTWRPGTVSRIYGWFHVWRYIGIKGKLYCLRQAIQRLLHRRHRSRRRA